MKMYTTTRENKWQAADGGADRAADCVLAPTGAFDQTIEGFGGCFNELGQIALSKLSSDAERAKVLDLLFDPAADGLRLNFCRLPIGASDYAEVWYSHNECAGDLEMNRFSTQRDDVYLIPYIKEALRRNPDIKLFASPWSPPTWMKFPAVYNHGHLIDDPAIKKAYALYFALFVEDYARKGIKISQVHVQNEPFSDQKFPSCVWDGYGYADFIGKYLGPCFKERGLDAEIWSGTLNNDNLLDNTFVCMNDPDARPYVKGAAYQWGGKGAVAKTHRAYPDLSLMQSENECGDGSNNWDYAQYINDLFRHYLDSGVNSYIYWNMVLEPGGRSTWGWRQNAMVTADPATGGFTLNDEYYVMKHYSAFIQKGARRMILEGEWGAHAVAFRNPDGGTVLVTGNPLNHDRIIGFMGNKFTLQAESINTVVL